MNAFAHPSLPAVHLPFAVRRGRARRGAFALVVTLLILSLLIVVAVSYLSSMVGERQTADAYTSKARAEQFAQAGVDSAMAILTESFRDFPDSATVWDPQQTVNTGTPSNPAIVNTPNNEGTSLYLRAVPNGTVANPLPLGTPAPGGTPVPANDPGGNDPNNPACKNFVLPLISGVPNGQAQLVSNKANIFPKKMDLSVSDPAQQIYTDLNVRRFGPSLDYPKGDLQGVIGSPPDWTASNPMPVGPKPARAYWVNLNDNAGHLTGRYAFWIEDESFRTNINYANFDNSNPSKATNPPPAIAQRADNSPDGKSLTDPVTGLARSILPKDMFLAGALAGFPTVFADGSSSTGSVLNARGVYPASFLPEPLAFTHVANASASPAPTPLPTPAIDGLRYLTTTQSGTLNLTRHGTQRLNLNATTTIDALHPVTMPEIRKLVEAIRFHLPNFGQRFYRTSNPDSTSISAVTRNTILNKSTDVPADNAEIYLYKTAANLRDYVDVDDVPTMIARPQNGSALPALGPATAPAHPFGSDLDANDGPNYMWAQGKDGAPFLQEAVVRYRPSIQIVGTGPTSKANYTLSVDYYLEFWNMSDHDVKASDLGTNPFVLISNQQSWVAATIERVPGGTKPTSVNSIPVPGSALGNYTGDASPAAGDKGPPRDFRIYLGNTVYNAAAPMVPISGGVVFKAGTATVITTDPDSLLPASNAASVMNSRFVYGGQALVASSAKSGFYAPNVYYCPLDTTNQPSAKRTYSGPTNLSESSTYLRGVMPDFRGPKSVISNTYLDYEVEVTLGSDLGYIDCALGAVCISAGNGDGGSGSTNGYDFTWTDATNPAQKETHNDYLHGGTLGGNAGSSPTPSEQGDPRTNNEQLTFAQFAGTSFLAQPDQSRYGTAGKNDAPPFTLGTPNAMYVKPAAFPYPWADYFDWNTTTYPTTTLNYTTAPSVVADAPLTSIGQLGDIFDPARLIGTVGTYSINNSRGGGRTLKIGQRDDRYSTDPTSNPAPNNTADHVAASSGWASWRLTDVFGIGDALELPARININGVARDNGAALRAALTGLVFQPQTQADANGNVVDPRIHGASQVAGTALKTLPTDSSGVVKLVNQIKSRLAAVNAAGANTPFGPFFERGELGELANGGSPIFGTNVSSTFVTSIDLLGTGKDLNHTFDRGREELFRRLVELICTRGDTFTVYVVGQSLSQADVSKPPRITGTHRMRVTFRLVPKLYTDLTRTTLDYFHPGNSVGTDGSLGPAPVIPDPDTDTANFKKRFAKPDLYDVQILEVNPL